MSYTDSSKEPHSTEYKCNETEKYTICNINEGELVDSGDLQQDKLIYNEKNKKYKNNYKKSFYSLLFTFAGLLLLSCIVFTIAKCCNKLHNESPIDYIIRGPPLLRGLSKCEICEAGITVIQSLLSMNKSENEVAKGITNFCIRLRIEDKKICQGIVNVYKIEVLTVIDNLALSPLVLCGLIRMCPFVKNPFPLWNVTFPNVPKPPLEEYKESNRPALLVLQLSDIHIDFSYSEGSETLCSQPVCCRGNQNQNISSSVIQPAGRWGMYRNCDTPPALVDHLFSHLAATRWDYIIWTGDTPGHNIWNQTRKVQLNTLDYITKKLASTFPGVKVYPALGNHESSPVNSYPQPSVKGSGSVQWLYDSLAKHWQFLGLSKDTAYNITRGGFYTELIKPKFRVVSLNMNYCNTLNWWLLLNTTDPASQLQWFIGILQKAETSHEKVHVIGHIPPGSGDCMKAWSWNYYKIVNRYENTITGQFFGHTHFDTFQMFYEDENNLPITPAPGVSSISSSSSATSQYKSTSAPAASQPNDRRSTSHSSRPPPLSPTPDLSIDLRRPTSVAYISPSITTYNNLNPGYRTYNIDPKFYHVLDHTTFIMNLSEANAGNPKWQREYSAKETYNLENLSVQSWDALIKRFFVNDTLLQTFYNYYWKSHAIVPYCNTKCRNSYVCEIVSGRSHDPNICMGLNVTEDEYRNYTMAKKFC